MADDPLNALSSILKVAGSIGAAIVGVAIIAVLVGKNSQTPTTIGAASSGLASIIKAAVAPVSGVGTATSIPSSASNPLSSLASPVSSSSNFGSGLSSIGSSFSSPALTTAIGDVNPSTLQGPDSQNLDAFGGGVSALDSQNFDAFGGGTSAGATDPNFGFSAGPEFNP